MDCDLDDGLPHAKSCTTQHYSLADYPTSEWLPEQLTAYAQAQNQSILDDEQKLAVRYWRLGLALNLLRKNFHHGQWEQFLGWSRIEKTKASRAMAIARTFRQEQDLAGLTVKDADGRRARRDSQPIPTSADRPKKVSKIGRFLDHVAKTAELVTDEAGFAEAGEAVTLLPMVDQAIEKLEQIRDLLREQAGENHLAGASHPPES
jgi:hypothetical protein